MVNEMKIFKAFFIGTLAALLALFLAGQVILLYRQHQAQVHQFSASAVKEVSKSYEAVASFIKLQM